MREDLLGSKVWLRRLGESGGCALSFRQGVLLNTSVRDVLGFVRACTTQSSTSRFGRRAKGTELGPTEIDGAYPMGG